VTAIDSCPNYTILLAFPAWGSGIKSCDYNEQYGYPKSSVSCCQDLLHFAIAPFGDTTRLSRCRVACRNAHNVVSAFIRWATPHLPAINALLVL